MIKKLVFCIVVVTQAAWVNAADFFGEFGGAEGSTVKLNGRSYPVLPDVSVLYRGQQVALDRVPAGTRVSYTLENVDGVGTVVAVVLPDAQPELDELFPPR